MSTEWEEVKDQAYHHTLKLMETTAGWNCTYSYGDDTSGVYHEKYKTDVELSADLLRFYVEHELIFEVAPANKTAKALKAFQSLPIVQDARSLIEEVHELEETRKEADRAKKVMEAITDRPEMRIPEVEDEWPVWDDKLFLWGEKKPWWKFW